jgi:hypothetical protein
LELELERNFLLRSQVELELGTFSEGGTLGTLGETVFFGRFTSNKAQKKIA